MKVVVSEKSPIQREIEVSVDSSRVQQSYDKHLRDVLRTVNIPGFRRGKAPRALVERYANKEHLQRSVFEEVGVPAYKQAIEQQKLSPLGEPAVELVQFEPGKDLVFKALIEVRPDVTVEKSEYEGIEVSVPRTAVEDSDIDRFIDNLREQGTRTVTVDEDRGLTDGDVAVVDLEARDGDKVVPNGTGENVQLLIDDELFVPGFAKNLHGMKVEEKKTFDFDFADDYVNKDLAGKKITFNFELKTIKKREVPELDDDFAREVSRFSTVEELKNDIRETMQRNLSLEVGRRGLQKIADKRQDIPVPRTFSNNVISLTLQNQAQQLAQAGIRFEDYLRRQNLDLDALVTAMLPNAEQQVRAELVLESIARKEEIVISDAEMETELQRYALEQQREFDDLKAEMKKNNELESFRLNVMRQRVLMLVAGKAVVKPEEEAAVEAPAAAEAPPADEASVDDADEAAKPAKKKAARSKAKAEEGKSEEAPAS